MITRTIAATFLAAAAAALPDVAFAYVGPGAGLSLAAAFWAILAAVGTIVVFTLMWPVRRLLRRRSGQVPRKSAQKRDDAEPDTAGMAHGRGGHGS